METGFQRGDGGVSLSLMNSRKDRKIRVQLALNWHSILSVSRAAAQLSGAFGELHWTPRAFFCGRESPSERVRPASAASRCARPKLVEHPQSAVVGLRVLGELPAPVSIEDQHTSARLTEHVVRVAHGVRLVQVAQRVRQERPGERVAACAVRLDGVRLEHGGTMLLRDVWGCNAVRRGCRGMRVEAEYPRR